MPRLSTHSFATLAHTAGRRPPRPSQTLAHSTCSRSHKSKERGRSAMREVTGQIRSRSHTMAGE
ncbi:hypothetical protein B9Z19DRAFT_1070565 [Tuber borchii]|uniref:Uncharacterized protein n=1 Tax=Tuber borchii TaxID=42251 RepID=A0A2T7A962_TUBBO|nr:hypothetical protein B9Z19DRAFT_1070565 [Tuber borchii]